MVDLQKAYPSASILVSDAEGWYDDGVLGPDEFRGRVHTMPVRLESSNCGAKENNLDSQSPMRLRAGSRLKLGDVLKRIRRSGSTGACNSSREAPSPKKDDDDDTLVSEPWIRVDGDFSGTDCIPTSYQSLDWDSDLVECTRSQTSSALTDFVGDDGCDELEPEEEEEERHKQAPVEISKYFSISVHSRKSTRRKSRSPNRSPTRHSASVMIRKDKQQQKESGRRAFSIHVVRRPQQSMQSPERSGPFGAEVSMSPTSGPGIMSFSVQHLAEELALIDSEQLRQIQSTELEDCRWMKKDKELRAPNIVKTIQDFNRLALTVSTEILEQGAKQDRATHIQFFIKLAAACLQLRNFNSLQAVLGGLQCSAIHRLDSTWKEVSVKRKRQLRKLAGLMSGEENFTKYRQALKSAVDSPPCVPFLGVFLSKVVQLDAYSSEQRSRTPVEEVSPEQDGAPLENRGSNTSLPAAVSPSCHSVSSDESSAGTSALSEFRQYQLASLYRFQTRPHVRSYLMRKTYKTEAEAFELSMKLEPSVQKSN